MSVVDGGPSLLPLEATAAIARQCFLNEYAWFEGPDETREVAALAASAAVEAPPDAMRLTALAAYRPLYSVNGIDSGRLQAGGALAELLRQQLADPAEELRIRGTLRRLTASANETSKAVKEQYEANPYPRWSRMGHSEHAEPAADVLRRVFPGREFSRLPRSGVRILIAGCGTGRHAIQAALRFADSRVLAFDLSLSSLAYAARKTREMGLTTIEYCQGDIMALGSDVGHFDIIESVGVLHHLADPLAGWRALLEFLAPGGAMRVGLYSELGRRHIVRAQEFAASFSADAVSLRNLRRAIIEARDDAHLKHICKNEDFFNLSGCRDMLLHVQEHRFNAGDLAAMLQTLQLEFLGFELPDPRVAARYREGCPGDARLTDLAGWQAFEAKEPDTFFGMYNFWVRRCQDGRDAQTTAAAR
jgi:2-polyprenyl-3-methyl-5-hydroxy-6-metoxy-1,4-benzoquinol methylase